MREEAESTIPEQWRAFRREVMKDLAAAFFQGLPISSQEVLDETDQERLEREECFRVIAKWSREMADILIEESLK